MKLMIFYKYVRCGGIRIYNPDPYDMDYPHSTVYFDYTLKQAQQRFRKEYGLQRRHIEWIEL